MHYASSLMKQEIEDIVDEAFAPVFRGKIRLAVRLARTSDNLYDAEDALREFDAADKVVAVWRSARTQA